GKGVTFDSGGLSIKTSDVTATAVSINPRYQRRNDESVVEGLIATRTIAVTLRDLDLFGELMNKSLALGINNLDPIRLDTSNRDAKENEALELAMADARQEAARVAAGFSVILGPVINVIVGGQGPRPQAAAMEMRMVAAGGDFSPGMIHIDRRVQATFAIHRE
ncbi:MAG: SIMPL domain-containing protein, partial [Pseudomonadales bacterium]